MFNHDTILLPSVNIHWNCDLRELLRLCSLLLVSFFQQNSLLSVALWFSPLVLLNMRSQPFSLKVFSFLQVAGGAEGSQGQIEIFSLNRPIPRAVKSLQVDSPVRCLEYVPLPSPTDEVESGVHKTPSAIGSNICVGLDDGRWATQNIREV